MVLGLQGPNCVGSVVSVIIDFMVSLGVFVWNKIRVRRNKIRVRILNTLMKY